MICPMCKKNETLENLKLGGLQVCNRCCQKYLDGLIMQEKPLEYFEETPFVVCPECYSDKMKLVAVEAAAYDYNDILGVTKGHGTLDDFLTKNKDVLLEFKCENCNTSHNLRVKAQEEERGRVKVTWERIPD